MTIETSGYFDFDRVRPVIDMMDMIFIDIKSMDNKIHKQYTGVSNKLILDNIKK